MVIRRWRWIAVEINAAGEILKDVDISVYEVLDSVGARKKIQEPPGKIQDMK